MTDDHTDNSDAAREPSFRERLEAVLPPWTHWHAGLFGFTARWTTTDGSWSISAGGFNPTAITGPGGRWTFNGKDADHVIGVLRALDAIPADEPA